MKNAHILAVFFAALAASQPRAWGANEKSGQDLLNCPSQTWHIYMPDFAAAHSLDRINQFEEVKKATNTGKFDDGDESLGILMEPNAPFFSRYAGPLIGGTYHCDLETRICGDDDARDLVVGEILIPNYCAQDAAQSLAYRKSFFEHAKDIPGLQIDCEPKTSEILSAPHSCGPVPAPRLSGGS
jgi:hypothetical protein